MLTGIVAPAAAAASPPSAAAEAVVDGINSARAQHGLRALRVAPKLMRSAQGYSRQLMRVDGFGHGSSYHESFRTAGEILALTPGWGRRPASVLRMWMRSAGHRAVILSRAFRYVGVGAVRGRFGGELTTVWVAHFGAH